MDITIEGLGEVLQQLKEAPADIRRRAKVELYQGLERIRGAAVERAPVETGALRNSALVTPDPVDELAVALSFGGAAAPYAVYVHENLTAHHPVGEAKFLERAALEHGPEIVRALRELLESE